MRALLTAFGPFPGAPVNPTATIIKRAALSAPPGVQVETRVLNTEFQTVPAALADAGAPDVVVMTGLAAGADRLRVELIARNEVRAGRPDAGGRSFEAGVIDPGAPGALTARADVDALLTALAEAGGAFEVSRDAGRYVCEFAYFHALRRFTGARVVFLHLPMTQTAFDAGHFLNGEGPSRLPLMAEDEAARLVSAALASQIG
ncbi:MAG: hypothetical protein ACLFQ5_07720 [Oceanicaulis sp.]